MVFYAFTLVMKPRNRFYTKQGIKELTLAILNAGGMIRSLTNEGIIRPYNRRRDTDNNVLTYARYLNLQVDMGEDEVRKFEKILRDHPDVFVAMRQHSLEAPTGMKKQPGFFPLDTFVRKEEELNWPPQASADLYEQLDMNWKEFSRTRWSNYLRN
ncbi:Hypothetical protein, putative [Bodo saltans]|uniref:Uncharacterized protein n=1 Tax=Bodo saltans TaxID=75058 RepID=A0A0S4KFM8_BODSA|nr:Hypothetical protein, putative [Bodo saltans]|eukprot:CUI14458.1 Hypothetical protein, putative [Bodo saltans]